MQRDPQTAGAGMTTNRLILLVTAFLLMFGNGKMISAVLVTYPPDGSNVYALLSLIVVFGGATVLMLALLCIRQTTKPVLMMFLLLSSLAAYFMDSYGVIISDDMLRNVAHTNTAEALELFTPKLLLYLAALGLFPAFMVWKVPLRWQGARREIFSRLKLTGIMLVLVVGTVLAFGSFYASFFREHKQLRSYANPTYYAYSVVKYSAELLRPVSSAPITKIGLDARTPVSDVHRELVIMVVGETARSDRFALNGYHRDTNPQLRRKNVISFTNFHACGTSTAVSVPCMFMLDGESKSTSSIHTQENLLDVVQRSGASVLWRDNNSDSKGVASRVQFEDFRSPKVNPLCDIECRDEGMLSGLQAYIDSKSAGDILIVLHQMGNHGPSYYRRYPAGFEKFTPVCKDSELNRCSRDEIGNAYDNAILYTDHFLGKVIELLERNDSRFETAMFYVSDHGESLGENGLYLHGLPKAIAPDEQIRVPAIMWFGSNFHAVVPAALRAKTGTRFTHNNVFHTLLGLFEIETTSYVPAMDMLDQAKPRPKQ